MDFETLVISFSYLIPASGPGKIEARAQQKFDGQRAPNRPAALDSKQEQQPQETLGGFYGLGAFPT